MNKIMSMVIACLLMAACATLTPEEKAAREAAVKEKVKTAVVSQKYRINVTSMKPERGISHSVSTAWLKVDSTTVEWMLPYAGRDDIPHMKSRAEVRMGSKIDFKSDIKDYVCGIQPGDGRAIIKFKVENGIEYKFTVTIENNGNAKINLEPEGSDKIEYEGYVNISK